MNLWILALSHFIHVMATVVWIGGILITLLVILPGSKTALESQPMVGKLMKEVAKRFTPMANISILMLIATGIIIFYYDKNYTFLLDLGNRWNVVIGLKHFFVATMIIIHFYRGLILNPKIERFSSQPNENRTSTLKKISLDLVKINFALGIIVLLLTAVSISY
ncbi:MAG: CopD family protein [Desulfobacteraceae bacterium]|nr:CopD family protein [Desulfobacteraceae bacterium]